MASPPVADVIVDVDQAAEHSSPLDIMPRNHLAALITLIDRHKNSYQTPQRWYAARLPTIPGFANFSVSSAEAANNSNSTDSSANDFSSVANYTKEQRAEALKLLITRIPHNRFSEAIIGVLKEAMDDEVVWLDKPTKPPATRSTANFYSSSHYKKFAKKNPDLHQSELLAHLSQKFKLLTDEKRQKYENQRKEQLEKYEADLAIYNAEVKAIQQKRRLPENVNGNATKKRKGTTKADSTASADMPNLKKLKGTTKTDAAAAVVGVKEDKPSNATMKENKEDKNKLSHSDAAAQYGLIPPKTPYGLFKDRLQEKNDEARKAAGNNEIQPLKSQEIQREWSTLKRKKKLRYINAALPDIDRYYAESHRLQRKHRDMKASVKGTALDADRLLTAQEKEIFAVKMDLKRPVANGYQVFVGLRREQLAQEKAEDGSAGNDDDNASASAVQQKKFKQNNTFQTECSGEWKQLSDDEKAPYNNAAATARKTYDDRLQEYIMSLPIEQREGASIRLGCHSQYTKKWMKEALSNHQSNDASDSE